MGDWGLGFGDWGLGPIPNPQSPKLEYTKKIKNYIINIKLFFLSSKKNG